jgi:hypothetical protein
MRWNDGVVIRRDRRRVTCRFREHRHVETEIAAIPKTELIANPRRGS